MVKILDYLKTGMGKFFWILSGLIILFGIYLRAKTYFLFSPTWCDEVFLINNIVFKPFFSLFLSLDNLQAAPPLLLVLIKLIAKIIGAEYELFALRLLPFLFSCFSVVLFFFFLLKTIQNKIILLAGLILFSINGMLIYYSSEVKQYSSDVFFCLLLFYLYDKFNIQNTKQFLISFLIAFIFPFFSFTTIFVMIAMVLYKLYEINGKEEKKTKYIIILMSILFSAGILWLFLNSNNHNMFAFLIQEYQIFLSLIFYLWFQSI